MKRTVLFVLLSTLTGCLSYAPQEACPAYNPSHALTDQQMKMYNGPRDMASPGWVNFALENPGLSEWRRSAWIDRRIPVCTATRASMSAILAHYRADGSEISRSKVLYAIELRDGQWVIAGRSSNAI